jgi:CubicO group peptidase (beta-lactamase class C family)
MAMEQYGELDGNRILKPKTVVFMTQNQLNPAIAATPFVRFGLGFGINLPVITSKGYRGGGRWTWGGAACSYFFIDPKQDVTAVFATQLFPFDMELNNEFHHIVLESLAQEEQTSIK